MTGAAGRRVFPVGHRCGTVDAVQPLIGVDGTVHELDPVESAVWSAAAARAGTLLCRVIEDDDPPGALVVDAAARSAAAARLVEGGLLAVTPEPVAAPETLEFLRTHAVCGLYIGLGEDGPGAGPGSGFRVGVPGVGEVSRLDPGAYELWLWGQLAPSLWHVCLARAAVAEYLVGGERRGRRPITGQMWLEIWRRDLPITSGRATRERIPDTMATLVDDLARLVRSGCGYLAGTAPQRLGTDHGSAQADLVAEAVLVELELGRVS